MRLLHTGDWFPDYDIDCAKVVYWDEDLKLALRSVQGRKLCFQAGGNCGVWANLLVKEFEQVWTVEPVLENYLCLLRNIRCNIKPIWAALGDKPGSTGMMVNPKNAGSGYLDGQGRIPVITIDELQLPACDFIILDIEGMEPLALQGAKETIEKYHPVIQVEDRGNTEKFGFKKEWSSEFPG